MATDPLIEAAERVRNVRRFHRARHADLEHAIREAQESIEFVEGLLRNMHDNEALSASEYFALEGPLRFTRTNILNVEGHLTTDAVDAGWRTGGGGQ